MAFLGSRYGAQGASSDYVISLEGTQEGRKALASQRAFYISASRAKDHVQIYTDGLADWTKAVKMPEREAKTAHDALKPETQRQQARAIWAMGQPLARTAIGRTWVRHQGMDAQAMTARIIPATKRYPEPALALPLYDNNGKSAGLALVPVIAGDNGRLTQGETRMVATEGARGAVLQRSHSGKTVVVNSLQEALDTVRARPQDGVVWQTGEERPSAHLLKISRGEPEQFRTVALPEEKPVVIPKALRQDLQDEARALAAGSAAEEQAKLAEQARAEAARQREMQLRDGQEKIRLPDIFRKNVNQRNGYDTKHPGRAWRGFFIVRRQRSGCTGTRFHAGAGGPYRPDSSRLYAGPPGDSGAGQPETTGAAAGAPAKNVRAERHGKPGGAAAGRGHAGIWPGKCESGRHRVL